LIADSSGCSSDLGWLAGLAGWLVGDGRDGHFFKPFF